MSSILQTVTVTPGFVYQFSFAERLVPFLNTTPVIPDQVLFVARVYYTSPVNPGIQVDLANITIDGLAVPQTGSFNYHETLTSPVPANITQVVVRFDLITVANAIPIEWDVDAVSLSVAA